MNRLCRIFFFFELRTGNAAPQLAGTASGAGGATEVQ